jgi:hypothetical protein
MTENLIETVGERALEQSRRVKIGTTYEELRANVGKAALLATLEGIREPAMRMRFAGRVHEPGTVEDPYNLIPGSVWRAMIDALRAYIESAE